MSKQNLARGSSQVALIVAVCALVAIGAFLFAQNRAAKEKEQAGSDTVKKAQEESAAKPAAKPAETAAAPAAATTPPPAAAKTEEPAEDLPEPVEHQESGDKATKFSQKLEEGEVLVGHAHAFQEHTRCVAFLVAGPGSFDFSVQSGIFYKHTEVTAKTAEALLQRQGKLLSDKYNCTPVQFVRLGVK